MEEFFSPFFSEPAEEASVIKTKLRTSAKWSNYKCLVSNFEHLYSLYFKIFRYIILTDF